MTTQAQAPQDMHALIGRSATITHVVKEADTAANWGNELPVLATPVLLWLSEIAAMEVIGSGLSPRDMTVGLAHDSAHQAPSVLGDTVTVHAELRSIEGKKLVFNVSASDGRATVLAGRHTRAVVDKERFVSRLPASKSAH
ncbi:thioesterase family protein [Streptomyces sp. NBC_00199]|uniref:thioesterase family protein n=1 Tax=Streptomyces sp. NBC_00199 TaxID=2975678 RepID=UPI00224EB917|nr:hypothetical protein [Streptomyces sp. NBC_00199]MCX5265948.1 hypothetical protein [Streptomyces sp. NBC_00199]